MNKKEKRIERDKRYTRRDELRKKEYQRSEKKDRKGRKMRVRPRMKRKEIARGGSVEENVVLERKTNEY